MRVNIVHELFHCIQRDASESDIDSREVVVTIGGPLMDDYIEILFFVIESLLPACFLVRETLSNEFEVVVFALVCVISSRRLLFLVKASDANASFELEHLLFEFVEVGEAEEGFNSLCVFSLVLLVAIFEVQVEVSDGLFVELLVQLGIDHRVQYLHIILENNCVL